MKKKSYLIALVAFYIGAICFFIGGNNVAGGLNLFSGTCFLVVYVKGFNKKS